MTSGCPRWWHAGIAGCTLPLVEGVAPRVVLAYETFWTLVDWDGWNDKGVSSTQDSNHCKYCGGEHLKEKERDHVGFLRCSEITCNTPDCPITDVMNMGKFWGRSQSLLEMGPVESPRTNFDVSRSLLHLHPHIFFSYSLRTHILVMVLYLWTRVLNFVKNRLSFTGLIWKTKSITESKTLRMGSSLKFPGPVILLNLSHHGTSFGRQVLLMRKGRNLGYFLINPNYIPWVKKGIKSDFSSIR